MGTLPNVTVDILVTPGDPASKIEIPCSSSASKVAGLCLLLFSLAMLLILCCIVLSVAALMKLYKFSGLVIV